MSVDQPTEDVLKASAEVERARAQVADARRVHMAAAERHRAAEEHLEGTLQALQEAVRAKALADLKATNSAASAEAFRLAYPYPSKSILTEEGTPRATRFVITSAGTFINRSQAAGTARRAIDDGPSAGFDADVPLGPRFHGLPISVQVRTLFRINSTLSFNATDVQRLLELPPEKESVVRQNLRRLAEAGFITREERGLYRLNPVPHAPPPIEED